MSDHHPILYWHGHSEVMHALYSERNVMPYLNSLLITFIQPLQAYLHGLTTWRYVWIMHYGNNPRWMDKGTDDGLCSAEVIKGAAEGHLVIRDLTLREDHVTPLAGYVSTQ